MFERLIESGPGRRRGGMQAALSVALHGVLAIVAVRATTIAAEPRAERVVAPDTTLWIVPERDPAGRAVPRSGSGDGGAGADVWAPLPTAPRFEAPGVPPLGEAVPLNRSAGAALESAPARP